MRTVSVYTHTYADMPELHLPILLICLCLCRGEVDKQLIKICGNCLGVCGAGVDL